MNIEMVTLNVSDWINSHYQKSYLKLKYSLIVTYFTMLASKMVVSSELLIIIMKYVLLWFYPSIILYYYY